MAQLRIFGPHDVQPQNIRGFGEEAGRVRRIIATEHFFFNVDEVSPGFSPHRWHKHTKCRREGYEVEYPHDFEEIYFILSGRGLIQWKTEDGDIREQEVRPGDTRYMPPDVVEHQLLNNGTEILRLAVVGAPPPRKKPSKA